MKDQFRPLNKIEKIFLKYTNRPKYKQYKIKIIDYKVNAKRSVKLNAFLESNEILNPDKIVDMATKHSQINMIHAGNAGDIIYALPTIKAISKLVNVPINLYLLLDQPHGLPINLIHPLGNVTLNQQMADLLIPLLNAQEYLNHCSCYKGEDIHIKLDQFRDIPMFLDKGNIIRWYNYITGVIPLVAEPWLKVSPRTDFSKKIVIARSGRYRNPHISYDFLNEYKDLCFIGVKSEYLDIRKHIPTIEFIEVKDFLEMAEIIAGAAFFIGNQSFPFSVAEALKVPRILETSFEAPNVIPDGEHGYDFYLQEHFEWMVKNLDKKRQQID